MAKVDNGRRGSFRFSERRKRKKTVCTSCNGVYIQRYRPNGGINSGKLCCPICGNPTGQQ